MTADEFNALYPAGTPVLAYPGARPEQVPTTRKLITRTRTAAWVADHGKPVVMVDGLAGWISLTHVDPFRATDTSPEASAARWVPNNPRPLCLDFQQKPDPAAYWCANCGWNQTMHADEARRTAIAAALECLPETEVTR
ncbi:hypothetical protein [Streptomyces sp. NPDC006739]|uniref:hypothetical protein n=1 Tax=Streptomyces sp. NPDC006739 TaxID=3364763 RepID=UPI0036C1C034